MPGGRSKTAEVPAFRKDVGRSIENRRKERGLSRGWLGKQLGVKPNDVTAWEEGYRPVPAAHRDRLAGLLWPDAPNEREALLDRLALAAVNNDAAVVTLDARIRALRDEVAELRSALADSSQTEALPGPEVVSDDELHLLFALRWQELYPMPGGGPLAGLARGIAALFDVDRSQIAPAVAAIVRALVSVPPADAARLADAMASVGRLVAPAAVDDPLYLLTLPAPDREFDVISWNTFARHLPPAEGEQG